MHRALKIVALCALVSAPIHADVIHVNESAAGANDGSSWTDAFTDLQAALGVAGPGDAVWVAAGIYRPTATADRAVSFALENGVAVYGGFTGTEVAASERDPAAHHTILSGDIGSEGDPSDNSYHVVVCGGAVTASAVLDGFTIAGGQANGVPNDTVGGGMFMSGGSPTLANLVFLSNFASSEGGGLYVTGSGVTLTRARFVANSVSFGGFGGGLRTAATLTCRDCEFRSNGVAGAVLGSAGISSSGNLTLINTIVAQNNPSGIHVTGDNNTFLNCTIAFNAAYGLALLVSQTNTLRNTIVWGNGADGIFNDGGSTLNASFGDTQGALLPGAGNISANPAFLAPPGDLRTGQGSPVVDAGNNAAVLVGVVTDIDGLPRYFDDPVTSDTGFGTPPIVDMGAHERIPLTISAPADADRCEGTDVAFSVFAQGQPGLTYQWRVDGTPLLDSDRISGAQTAELALDDLLAADGGEYDVLVTDGVGQSQASDPATLTIHPGPARPEIAAPASIAVASTGNAASVENHPTAIYNWSLPLGAIGAGQGTSQISFDAGSPGTSMLLSVSEIGAGCASPIASTVVLVDFLDVPPGDVFHDFIVAVVRAGISAGCGQGGFCRDLSVTRAQLAVLLLKAKFGSGYSPPPCTGLFEDVDCPSTFANWIEQLSREGITAGCSSTPRLYCPDAPVTRQEMAVFILKTSHGAGHEPPACSAVFEDVPCPGPYADWIGQFYEEGITGGCNAEPLRFCPTRPNSRGQMAVFLARALNLQ